MEFLSSEDAHPSHKGKGKEPAPVYTRVRLAWYYRPSDVSDRPVADSRLLLAAIYSEICDVAQLRAKCYVVHRDKITDLAGWKKRPDRFYFNRLFDPYIKKEFEVIQSNDVRNRAYSSILCWREGRMLIVCPCLQFLCTSVMDSLPDTSMWWLKRRSCLTSLTPSETVRRVPSGALRTSLALHNPFPHLYSLS